MTSKMFRNPKTIESKLIDTPQLEAPLVADDVGYRLQVGTYWDYVIAVMHTSTDSIRLGNDMTAFFDAIHERETLPQTYFLLHSQLNYSQKAKRHGLPFYLEITGSSGSMPDQNLTLDLQAHFKEAGSVNDRLNKTLGVLQVGLNAKIHGAKVDELLTITHPQQLLHREYQKPEYKN